MLQTSYVYEVVRKADRVVIYSVRADRRAEEDIFQNFLEVYPHLRGKVCIQEWIHKEYPAQDLE